MRESIPLETIEAAASAQIGLPHEVLGFVQGTKHAVTMQFEFAAIWFGKLCKRLAWTRRRLVLMCLFRRCHHTDPLLELPFIWTRLGDLFPRRRILALSIDPDSQPNR
jgi:hypothetical protein